MMRRFIPILFLASFIALQARVVPHALFSDHCVLQQGMAVPVWGWADPGESVTVRFRGAEVTALANMEGEWKVELPTGLGGGPFTLEFMDSSDSEPILVNDVLVGEVWLAGGQSNMEFNLGDAGWHKSVVNGQAEAAKADYPTIRQFHLNRNSSFSPLNSVEAEWVVCTPETALDFSAVAFFFARDIRAAREVPVGVINSNWGGTEAEAWMSWDALAKFPTIRKRLEFHRIFAEDSDRALDILRDELDAWCARHDAGTRDQATWQTARADPSDWRSVSVPGAWEKAAIGTVDGVVWLRKTIDLPADWATGDAVLELGMIDDMDTTWVNGVKVGASLKYNLKRAYPVVEGVLHAGRNVIAIRVLDSAGWGGFVDATTVPQLRKTGAPESLVALGGEWQYRIGVDLETVKESPPRMPGAQAPTLLHNAMIAPLVPYAMKGVIWYQGESNATRARQYRELFPALIADWREQWGLGDFPFLFVQIAPYNSQPPEIREAQLLTLEKSPRTAMVVTIDLGDADDIHPANKEPVGERLALAARALAYGEDVVYSGPIFESMSVRGDAAVLRFQFAEPGLSVGGSASLRGFVMAGEDGVFHPATAVIEGETVVVRSPEVIHPIAVRYGWANIADGNLYNRAGLPASPFRTDVD